MAFTTYINVGIDGRGAEAGARTVNRSLDDIEKKVDRTNTYLDRLRARIGMVAGTAAAFYGVGTAIRSITESMRYLGEMENAQLGIASSFMSLGKYIDTVTGKTIEGANALKLAQIEAEATMNKLKVANLQTIATLDQLIKVYQEALPVAMAQGFNRDQVQQFTLLVVQAAGALRVPLDMLGEEARSLLTGAISTRNSRIAMALGITPDDIKQLQGDSTALFDFLKQKLSAFKTAGVESMNTWNGLWSNFKDISQQMKGTLFSDVFDTIKSKLIELTNSMMTIDEKTKQMKWNPEFLAAIDGLKPVINDLAKGGISAIQGLSQGFMFLAKNAETVKTTLMLLVTVGIGKYLGDILTKASLTANNWLYMTEQIMRGNLVMLEGNGIMQNTITKKLQMAQANAELALSELSVANTLGTVATKEELVTQATMKATIAKVAKISNNVRLAESELQVAMSEQAAALAAKEAYVAYANAIPIGVSRVAAANEIALANERLVVADNAVAVAEAKLTTQTAALTVAQQAATVAQMEFAGASSAKMLTAMTSQTAALAKVGASMTAYNAAIMQSTLLMRTMTAVTSTLGSVMAALGGPIGVAIMVLGALLIKLKEVRDAEDELMQREWGEWAKSLSQTLRNDIADKQKILDELRKKQMTPEERKQTLEEDINKTLVSKAKDLATAQKDLKKVQDEIAKGTWVWSPGAAPEWSELGLKEKELKNRINIIRSDILDARELMEKQAKLDEQISYLQQPKKTDDSDWQDASIEQLKAYDAAYSAYSKAVDDHNLAIKQTWSDSYIQIIDHTYNQGLMTVEDYETKKLNAQTTVWNFELEKLRERLKDQQDLTAKYRAAESTEGLKAQTARYKSMEEEAKIGKDIVELESKVKDAGVAAANAINDKHKDLSRTYAGIKADLYEMLGLYQKAAEERIKAAGMTPERQMIETRAKAGDDKDAIEAQANLKQQDDLNRAKAYRNELDKAASLILADLQIKEANIASLETFNGITKENAAKQRIALYTQQLDIMRTQQLGIDTSTADGVSAYMQLANSIENVTDKLRQQNLVLLEQTGNFQQGTKKGLEDFVMNSETAFQEGQKVVTEAITNIKNTLSDSFFDFLTGKFTSVGEYLQKFGQSMLRVLTDIAAQQAIIWILQMLGVSKESIAAANQKQLATSGALVGAMVTEAGVTSALTSAYWALAAAKAAAGLLGGAAGGGGSSFNGVNDVDLGSMTYPGKHFGGQILHNGGPVVADSYHGGSPINSRKLQSDERFIVALEGERMLSRDQDKYFMSLEKRLAGIESKMGDNQHSVTVPVTVNGANNRKMDAQLQEEIEETVIKVVRRMS